MMIFVCNVRKNSIDYDTLKNQIYCLYVNTQIYYIPGLSKVLIFSWQYYRSDRNRETTVHIIRLLHD